MLMRPNKAETAVHGCHCPDDMAMRMHALGAGQTVGWCSSVSLAFIVVKHLRFIFKGVFI